MYKDISATTAKETRWNWHN